MTETRRTYRALVIDDEPAGREAVRTLLEEVPEVEVVGEAANGTAAVERIRELRPDLLFLDIRMPDRDGFTVLEEVADELPGGVVFVTAHSEHAHRAFEVHALDYVLKPFGRPRFLAAVRRAIQRLEADDALGMKETLRSLAQGLELDRNAPERGEVAISPDARTTRIGVRVGSRTTLVEVESIDWVEADGDLVRIHVGERIHLLSSTLRALERTLPGDLFFRIHRSVLVNLGRVRTLSRERDGGGSVVLDDGVRLRVARGRWEDLEIALGLGSSSGEG